MIIFGRNGIVALFTTLTTVSLFGGFHEQFNLAKDLVAGSSEEELTYLPPVVMAKTASSSKIESQVAVENMDASTVFSSHFRHLYHYQAPKGRKEDDQLLARKECGDPHQGFQKYFLQNAKRRSYSDEDKIIYHTFFKHIPLRHMRNLKYVELGAFNGLSESNSRFFDTCLGWEGLLIEANPRTYEKLQHNRPHAHLASFAASCSVEQASENKTVAFHDSPFTNAAQVDTENAYKNRRTVKVPCGSMTPLLEELLDGHVHFLSLDVENVEAMVLENIDFSKVFIEVLIVENENSFCPKDGECESRDRTRAIMRKNGYHLSTHRVLRSDLYVHPKSKLLKYVTPKQGSLRSSSNAPPDRVQSSPATLDKSEFSNHFRNQYLYEAPTQKSEADEQLAISACGIGPSFDTFFQQDMTSRSRLNEDKIIYETFFKELSDVETKNFKYVELGAFDGVRESNTRFFDTCLGWDGLNIEANPKKYGELVSNRPHSHRASFAASCSVEEAKNNKTVTFLAGGFTNAAQILSKDDHPHKTDKAEVPCGSLTPLLQDLLGSHVHFLSLDVENAEPFVLENIDFGKVFIEILIVESVNHSCPKRGHCKSRFKSRRIMHRNGYHRFEDVVDKSDLYIHPRSRFLHVMQKKETEKTNQGQLTPVVVEQMIQATPILEKQADRVPPIVPEQNGQFTSDFRDMYRYRAPVARTDAEKQLASDECGNQFAFDAFFKQDPKSRSRLDEDKTVYEQFFKNINAKERESFKYVELGAYNGMIESNSRFFDNCLGWEGLLIEANPRKYDQVLTNRPHAHTVSFAASCSVEEANANKTVAFHDYPFANAAQADTQNNYQGLRTINVPCGSMTPLLEDLLGGHVHFLSLDVEGAEPMVLENIDFNKVFIEVLIVESENKFCARQGECESRNKARAIMKENGYHLFTDIIKKSDLYVHSQSRFLQYMQKEKVSDPPPVVALQTKPFTPYFRELYQYQPPSPRQEEDKQLAVKECGPGPKYLSFFQQSHHLRSHTGEDRSIYNTFFKHIPSEQQQHYKYLELGGFDGKQESNSRFFDVCMGWEGLLVEANPKKFSELRTNRPHAHLASYAAPCSTEEAKANKTVSFFDVDITRASQVNVQNQLSGEATVDVPCGSLTPLIQDLLGGTVHFLSLDVENAEPMVLQNIDFGKVFIHVLIVESHNSLCLRNRPCKNRDQVRFIMEANGYHLFTDKIRRSDLFVHPKSKFLPRIAE